MQQSENHGVVSFTATVTIPSLGDISFVGVADSQRAVEYMAAQAALDHYNDHVEFMQQQALEAWRDHAVHILSPPKEQASL